jgi:uncharacterized protein YciI
MLVVRYASSDPRKTSERSQLLADHKAYLRGSPLRILLSGPSAAPQDDQPSKAIVIAEVEAMEEFLVFSEGDPFVSSGVYDRIEIFEWRPSFGSYLTR